MPGVLVECYLQADIYFAATCVAAGYVEIRSGLIGHSHQIELLSNTTKSVCGQRFATSHGKGRCQYIPLCALYARTNARTTQKVEPSYLPRRTKGGVIDTYTI